MNVGGFKNESEPIRSVNQRWMLPLLLVLIPVIATLLWIPNPAPPSRKYPSPNGYDDFVEAVKLTRSDPPRTDPTNTAVWRVFVEDNRAALERARIGLGKQCLVSNEFNEASMERLHENEVRFKILSYLFRTEVKLRLEDGDTNAATQAAIDGYRFAVESTRGGMMIGGMIGRVMQEVAMNSIRDTIPHLNRQNTALLLDRFLAVEPSVPGAQSFLNREAEFNRTMNGMLQYVSGIFVLGWKQTKDLELTFTKNWQGTATTRRKFTAQLAKRLYELDHGEPATGWSDIVPKYLPVIPTNAKTGRPLLFL